jgi:predicted O-methyltransferase YrrM
VTQELWSAVDRYAAELLHLQDAALEAALEASAAAGLPEIQITPTQGRFLSLLARAQRARRILEIGTLGGYSAIWLARALSPGGRLLTLEIDPGHAAVARSNLERAGLSEAVEIRVGPAAQSLAQLAREEPDPFDLVFIDADKPGYPDYLLLVLPLVHRGSWIVADNVVRGGAVADDAASDPNVIAVRRYLALAAAEPRLEATVVQTVGGKGYDGMSIALVTADP